MTKHSWIKFNSWWSSTNCATFTTGMCATLVVLRGRSDLNHRFSQSQKRVTKWKIKTPSFANFSGTMWRSENFFFFGWRCLNTSCSFVFTVYHKIHCNLWQCQILCVHLLSFSVRKALSVSEGKYLALLAATAKGWNPANTSIKVQLEAAASLKGTNHCSPSWWNTGSAK